MHEAVLTTISHDAKSVAASLHVDNVSDNRLKIETKVKKRGKIVTHVSAKSIPTLLNTLDDIIHCQMSAEKII